MGYSAGYRVHPTGHPVICRAHPVGYRGHRSHGTAHQISHGILWASHGYPAGYLLRTVRTKCHILLMHGGAPFFFIPCIILALLSRSLAGVTQIRDHIASLPPPSSSTVRARGFPYGCPVRCTRVSHEDLTIGVRPCYSVRRGGEDLTIGVRPYHDNVRILLLL